MRKNNLDILRILSIIILTITCQSNSLFSQLSGSIECPAALEDTVKFGSCMVGDFKFNTFIITNTGTKNLKIGPARPSFSIEFAGVPNHQYDHEEFNDNLPGSRELIIPVGETRNIIVTYDASSDTNTYIFGNKIAKLTIGLYDAELPLPLNIDEFVAYREFKLISNKVRTYVSGDKSTNNFDSIYVNPVNPVEFTWNLSNVSDKNITLDTENLVWLTPEIFPEEFSINKNIPIYFPSNSGPVPIKISYSPKDLGEDKVLYSLGYTYNDTSGYTRIELRGFGVQQKLKLIECDAPFYKDTINFGKVWVGQEKEVLAILANDGNLNFLAETQIITDGYESEEVSNNFVLTKPLTNLYYRPTTGDSIKIIFKPDRIGNFFGKLKIKSDIDKRLVRAYPPEKLFENFYFQGIGIEPKFQVEFDTVDFGKIISHPDCPSSRTFTLKISNIGNALLIIKDYAIDAPFKLEIPEGSSLTVEPNHEQFVNIIFSASVLGDYHSILRFITNAISNDTVSIHIKASRVNPETIKLFIPDNIKSKPGNVISIPIIVNKEYISKARTFSSELTYNRSLLRFIGYNKLKTASENTDDSDINISELNGGGKLKINFETPGSQTFFMEKDTLIKLNFDTYIGDNISTAIAFIEPLFGDGICNKILIPSDTNGVFSIDSVCGLEYKLVPSTNMDFFISQIFPNPANDKIKIQFQLKTEFNLNLEMIDQIGTNVKTIFNGSHKSGFDEIEIDCSTLSSGIYYLRFSNGISTINRKINIVR